MNQLKLLALLIILPLSLYANSSIDTGKLIGDFGLERWFTTTTVIVSKIECRGEKNGAMNPEPRRAGLTLEKEKAKSTYKLIFDNAGYYGLDIVEIDNLNCDFDAENPLLVSCSNGKDFFSTYVTSSTLIGRQLDPKNANTEIFIKKYTKQLKVHIYNDEIINKNLRSENLIGFNLHKNSCHFIK